MDDDCSSVITGCTWRIKFQCPFPDLESAMECKFTKRGIKECSVPNHQWYLVTWDHTDFPLWKHVIEFVTPEKLTLSDMSDRYLLDVIDANCTTIDYFDLPIDNDSISTTSCLSQEDNNTNLF